MIAWIKFLIIPLVVGFLLQMAVPLIFFDLDTSLFWWRVSDFFISFFVGSVIFNLSPNKSIVWAVIYGFIHIGISVSGGIMTHGKEIELLGSYHYYEISIIQELARALGMILGIGGAFQVYKEDKVSNKEKDSSPEI